MVSLIAYGQLHDPRLLVVPSKIDPVLLQELHDHFESIEVPDHLFTMVATKQEIISSCDVFPITFLDMQRRHRLLYGDDVLEALDVGRDHLRLRCEQELKNLQLRMQNQFFRHKDVKSFHESYVRAWSSMRRAVDATLYLQTGNWVPDNEVWDVAATAFGWDPIEVKRCHRLALQDQHIELEGLRAVYAHTIELVSIAASVVDEIPESNSMIELVDLEESGGASCQQ